MSICRKALIGAAIAGFCFSSIATEQPVPRPALCSSLFALPREVLVSVVEQISDQHRMPTTIMVGEEGISVDDELRRIFTPVELRSQGQYGKEDLYSAMISSICVSGHTIEIGGRRLRNLFSRQEFVLTFVSAKAGSGSIHWNLAKRDFGEWRVWAHPSSCHD